MRDVPACATAQFMQSASREATDIYRHIRRLLWPRPRSRRRCKEALSSLINIATDRGLRGVMDGWIDRFLVCSNGVSAGLDLF